MVNACMMWTHRLLQVLLRLCEVAGVQQQQARGAQACLRLVRRHQRQLQAALEALDRLHGVSFMFQARCQRLERLQRLHACCGSRPASAFRGLIQI